MESSERERETLHPRVLPHLQKGAPLTAPAAYQSPRYTSPPAHTRFPSVGKGPHGERCWHPETFLTYLPRFLVKELPSKPPPRSLFRERERERERDTAPPPRASFIHLSKSPVDKISSRFPKWGPYEKRCPSAEPFLHILQGPQKGNPPSRFPSQREILPLQSPFQPYLKVPGR